MHSLKFNRTILVLALLFVVSGCQNKPQTQVQAPSLPKKVEVAIMMPLSGEHGQQGKRLAEIIRAGLEDSVRGNINSTTYDASDDILLQKAIDEAIKKNTKLILGPLFSNQAVSISHKAVQKDIYILTLSNNSSLANNDHMFVFGHAPIKQTEQLMDYLLKNGYTDVILLLPAATHTKNLVKIIDSIVQDHKGTIRLVQEYNHTPEDIDSALSKVAEVVESINESDVNTTKPLIYIADDPKNLPNIFSGLAKYGIDSKAVVCGDNRLDIDTPTQINIIFTGSLAHLNSKLMPMVQERFGSNYLNYMDKLAYDLGLVAGFSIGENFSKESLLQKLEGSAIYKTTSGSVRFIDHIADRKYDIISKHNEQYKTLYQNHEFTIEHK